MEDWNAIAAEVSDAIRSVSDISQPNGYPVTLRIPGEATGPEWDPQPGGGPTYKTLYAVEGFQEVRDASGTLIGQTRHTLTVTADPDAVPMKSHQVAIGVRAEDVAADTAFIEIIEVRPLAPAGVAVLYELDLTV
ncbi:hypothetical protein REJC140_00115 [Pseudorhizobium endolithicum]|uniref:Tail terminator n=1 Tax=Pseudorhizobium endolithicum TaxID=1191678 RepID=A0ABM8PCK9_9HYPH|nr:hypothetical protein [Pseudorhizobium endolithicum]CAD7023166.1 hypothetical protein REJC140_00115 [Pseudorhizobium endolithicum]